MLQRFSLEILLQGRLPKHCSKRIGGPGGMRHGATPICIDAELLRQATSTHGIQRCLITRVTEWPFCDVVIPRRGSWVIPGRPFGAVPPRRAAHCSPSSGCSARPRPPGHLASMPRWLSIGPGLVFLRRAHAPSPKRQVREMRAMPDTRMCDSFQGRACALSITRAGPAAVLVLAGWFRCAVSSVLVPVLALVWWYKSMMAKSSMYRLHAT